MMPKTINITDIPFTELELMKGRAERGRQIFSHRTQPLIYKFFSLGWEFADQAAQGYEVGYYSERLVPNLVGLIRDNEGNNRGYVMHRIPTTAFLDVQITPWWSRRALQWWYTGRIAFNDLRDRVRLLEQKKLIDLLYHILSQARASGYLFTEISLPNIWADQRGYYVIDLDALRSLEWIFCSDPNNPLYIRSLINRQSMNKCLQELIVAHHLRCPSPMHVTTDLNRFWEELIERNRLHGLPKGL